MGSVTSKCSERTGITIADCWRRRAKPGSDRSTPTQQKYCENLSRWKTCLGWRSSKSRLVRLPANLARQVDALLGLNSALPQRGPCCGLGHGAPHLDPPDKS